ncbi:MAG: cytochrome C oxidase Cbb3, partial [Blastocatellia bacterium]
MTGRCGVGVLALVVGFPAAGFAQDGGALYRSHCASCHDVSATRAPGRDSLSRLTPERIMFALDTGVMQAQGLARTPAERRALAIYLSGKSFGTEPGPDIARMACKEHPAFSSPFSTPNWNGWSTVPTNTRFQRAEAAGLDAARVPRLTLKWAFAFPGDISAYSQPTVAGGRVFVGSVGRRVFSLDAKTGCVYWSFLADASVRTAVTLGPMTGSTTGAFFGDLSANMYAVDAATGKLLWR